MIIRREALAAIVLSNNGFGQTNRKALIDAISEGSACHCIYLPAVFKSEIHTISYYCADGLRIAMKDDGVVSYLYGDQLGSTSVTADINRTLVSKSHYHPWGTSRYIQGTTPTDYAYTGQKQEGDIYFYNARWYDPQLGRFMQADTLVPSTQGIQGFDRYAYVNNDPVNGTDPSGHWMCDQYEPGCCETSGESLDYGRLYSYTFDEPLRYTIQGSYDFGIGPALTINRYQDDLISPPVLSSHPIHVAIQVVDLTVRLLEEFRPQPVYSMSDDVFWNIYVEDRGDQITISQISIYSTEETVILRNISVTETTTGRTMSQIIPRGIPNLKFGFETGFVGTFNDGNPSNGLPFYSLDVNFGMRCYDCGGNPGLNISGFNPYPLLPGSRIIFYQQWRNHVKSN